jgi:hypothetical protein
MLMAIPIIDVQTAAETARTEDFDGAIELARRVVANQFGGPPRRRLHHHRLLLPNAFEHVAR